MKSHRLFALLSAPFIFAAAPAMADSADESQAVIVVFQKDTPFHQFRAQADERATGDRAYLDRGVLGAVQRLEGNHRFKAKHVYSSAIKGFAGKLTKAQIEALKSEPTVAYIEADGIAKINAQTIPWGIDRVEADISSTLAGNGEGRVKLTTVYILDTGVEDQGQLNLQGHINFAGGVNTDCHGHGTHVAGTVGAKDNAKGVVGVAPGVKLYGVKVLGCGGSGSWSGVIQGIDWVTANAVKPAVANMSLGGDAITSVDNAVRASAASGVFYAVAAGNEFTNACTRSPARAGQNIGDVDNGIIATAATNNNDQEADFSNYGACVDIWAPGVGVISNKLGGGLTTMDGTSMASPHVAGAAALYLSKNKTATPVQVEAALRSHVITPGTISKGGDAIELLQVDDF